MKIKYHQKYFTRLTRSKLNDSMISLFRCVEEGKAASFLLESGEDSPFVVPSPYHVDRIETFVPTYLDTKLVALKHILDL